MINSSNIIFGAKIEISATKGVEKKSIYISFTFDSKTNEFEWKKSEKTECMYVCMSRVFSVLFLHYTG